MSDITVYTSNTCGHCTATKNFLKENNVEFTERNISTDKQARLELMKKGYTGVPIIVVDGEEIVGFDQPALTRALNL